MVFFYGSLNWNINKETKVKKRQKCCFKKKERKVFSSKDFNIFWEFLWHGHLFIGIIFLKKLKFNCINKFLKKYSYISVERLSTNDALSPGGNWLRWKSCVDKKKKDGSRVIKVPALVIKWKQKENNLWSMWSY